MQASAGTTPPPQAHVDASRSEALTRARSRDGLPADIPADRLLAVAAGGEVEAEVHEAVRRECHEEIGLQVQVETHLWSSVTPWGFQLEWFQISRHVHQQPVPNPQEVAEILWLSPEQLAGRGDLLGGMPAFLAAWQAGRFST